MRHYKNIVGPGMNGLAYNLRTQEEAKAGGVMIWGHTDLRSEFQGHLSYGIRPCLRKQNKEYMGSGLWWVTSAVPAFERNVQEES